MISDKNGSHPSKDHGIPVASKWILDDERGDLFVHAPVDAPTNRGEKEVQSHEQCHAGWRERTETQAAIFPTRASKEGKTCSIRLSRRRTLSEAVRRGKVFSSVASERYVAAMKQGAGR